MASGDFEKAIDDITKGSVAKQLCLGAAVGVCSGLAFTRVGKVAAAAIGGTIIFVTVASNQGWIECKKSTIEKIQDAAKKKVESFESNKSKIKTFVKKNISLVAGFAGGFAIGVVL